MVIYLVFQFVIFGSVKNNVYKTFAQKKMDDTANHWKNVFKIMTILHNLVPVYRFYDHLCLLRSIRFVKYLFPAKIWFVKTSSRTVKYESQVAELNPDFRLLKADLEENIYWKFQEFSIFLTLVFRFMKMGKIAQKLSVWLFFKFLLPFLMSKMK